MFIYNCIFEIHEGTDICFIKSVLDKIGRIYEVQNYPTFDVITTKDKCIEPTDVYCSTNLDRFIAISALRDDTPKYQIRINDIEKHWYNQGLTEEKGSFIFHLSDTDYSEYNDGIFWGDHKASYDELIEKCGDGNVVRFWENYLKEKEN